MTVKDVFDLRRQGRIEEAYEAIRPMYAQHKGRYTTLCMFWTAADVFKLRLEQGRIDEAEKILEALKRMLSRVEGINKELDSQVAAETQKNEARMPWENDDAQRDGSFAAAFIQSAEDRLANVSREKAGKKSQSATKALNQEQEDDSMIAISPEMATDISRGCEPTDTEPSEVQSTNLEHIDPLLTESEPVETLSTDSESNEMLDNRLLEDYSGRMIVSLDEGIIRPLEGVNAPQRVILACLTAHPGYSVPQISTSTGIPQNSIEQHVSTLIEKNLIEHRGSTETDGYYVK